MFYRSFVLILTVNVEMPEKNSNLDSDVHIIYTLKNFKKVLLECEKLNSAIANIKCLNKNDLFTTLNNIFKHVKKVYYGVSHSENNTLQDCFNLLHKTYTEHMKVICQNDKNIYLENTTISQKQIAQASSTTISEFQQHLIDLDEKERQLYDTIIIVAFIVLIGGSCISLFRCTECTPRNYSKVQKDFFDEEKIIVSKF